MEHTCTYATVSFWGSEWWVCHQLMKKGQTCTWIGADSRRGGVSGVWAPSLYLQALTYVPSFKWLVGVSNNLYFSHVTKSDHKLQKTLTHTFSPISIFDVKKLCETVKSLTHRCRLETYVVDLWYCILSYNVLLDYIMSFLFNKNTNIHKMLQ